MFAGSDAFTANEHLPPLMLPPGINSIEELRKKDNTESLLKRIPLPTLHNPIAIITDNTQTNIPVSDNTISSHNKSTEHDSSNGSGNCSGNSSGNSSGTGNSNSNGNSDSSNSNSSSSSAPASAPASANAVPVPVSQKPKPPKPAGPPPPSAFKSKQTGAHA